MSLKDLALPKIQEVHEVQSRWFLIINGEPACEKGEQCEISSGLIQMSLAALMSKYPDANIFARKGKCPHKFTLFDRIDGLL